MTSDEHRWAQAQSLLDGIPSEEAQQQLRRGRRTLQLGILVVLVLCVGLAVAVLAWLGDDTGSGSDDEPLWRSITGLLVVLAGLVILVPAALRQLRESRWRDSWGTPLLALDLGQRRQLAAEVKGRVPADPAHLPLARHLAATLVRQRPTPRLLLGFVVMAIGQLILSSSWWWAAILVLLIGAWPIASRTARRAQVFLDAHPVDPAP